MPKGLTISSPSLPTRTYVLWYSFSDYIVFFVGGIVWHEVCKTLVRAEVSLSRQEVEAPSENAHTHMQPLSFSLWPVPLAAMESTAATTYLAYLDPCALIRSANPNYIFPNEAITHLQHTKPRTECPRNLFCFWLHTRFPCELITNEHKPTKCGFTFCRVGISTNRNFVVDSTIFLFSPLETKLLFLFPISLFFKFSMLEFPKTYDFD